MLKRAWRLHAFNDVSRVLRHGAVCHATLLTIKWSPNALPSNRISCIVSNKISKKAVIRNRIKRRMREAARTVLIHCNEQAERSADFILIAKSAIVNATYQEIVAALDALWRGRHRIRKSRGA